MTGIRTISLPKYPINRAATPSTQRFYFSGKASNIAKELKAEAQRKENENKIQNNIKTKLTSEQAQQKAENEKCNRFKSICDTVIWRKNDGNNNKFLTVADLIAFVSERVQGQDYCGYTSVDALSEVFPGIESKRLKDCFDNLAKESYLGVNYGKILGRQIQNPKYWLRPEGEEMMRKLYPDIGLPTKEFKISAYHMNTPDYP